MVLFSFSADLFSFCMVLFSFLLVLLTFCVVLFTCFGWSCLVFSMVLHRENVRGDRVLDEHVHPLRSTFWFELFFVLALVCITLRPSSSNLVLLLASVSPL